MLALTAALVGPYFVDWTSYRADFEREAGRILGREVKVEGTASARLLPFPSVTFTDVIVAGIEPGEPAITVETFSMDAELAPFMRGDVHIFDMRLVRPTILVDVAEDGRLDWAMRPSVPVGAAHISLEKLTITEGSVAIRHAASGRAHRLTEINADISARSLAGPWRLDGSLRLDGMRTAVSVSTGAVDDGQRMRVRLRAQPERYPFALETDGSAGIEDGGAHYAGVFRLNGGTPAAAAQDEPDGPPAYRTSGTFDFDHARLAVETFRLETGPLDDPYVAEGAAEFALGAEPRFAIRADGAQIRFDGDADEAGEGMRLAQRLEAFHEFLLDLPRPAIPGRIEVALPAIVAGDTTVRNVHLTAEPSQAGWTVASLGATLPGRTTLEAEGELAVGDELDFAGSMLLAVAQPSGFAAWLARDVDDAIRRLPAAGFSAQVELSRERQHFRDLELVLGPSRFTGAIDSRTPEGGEPSLGVKLEGDRLDVEGMAAFASLFVSSGDETRLADRDLDFEISAGPVSAAGLSAETVDAVLRLRQGRLDIDRLSIGGLAGADVSATGALTGIDGLPSGALDASVTAPDLAPLVSTLARRFPQNPLLPALERRIGDYPGLAGDARLDIAARSSGQAADVTVTGEAGGMALSLSASSQEPTRPAGAPLVAEFSAESDKAASLYALAGLPGLPLGLAGPGRLDLFFDGTPADGGLTRLGFTGEGLDLSFEGATALRGEAISADGTVTLDSEDLEPWLATAGIAVPGFGLGLPARLSAGFDLDGGLVLLSGLSGEIAGSALRGDVNAQMRDGLPHLTGALSLRAFDLALLGELMVGAEAFEGAGDDWPDAAFAPAVNTPLTADLDLAVETLDAGTFARLTNARLALRLGARDVSISDLAATLDGAALSGIVDFRNDGGTGLLSSQLRLSDARAERLFDTTGVSGALDMTASVTASGKSVDGIVQALSGSGTAHLRDLAVAGVDPAALPDLLRLADGFGPEIDAEATAFFAPERVRRGAFEADALDIAFTIANGAVRAPPLRLEREDAVLSAELRADLGAREVTADALLTYAAGPEALAGTEPAVRFAAAGPLDALTVEVDTAPLAQFLTQRALEAEQHRVEAMQASLLERQRHRREARYYAALADQRRAAEEEARREAEEAARLERLLRRAEEEAERMRIEEEERRRSDEQTRLDAEGDRPGDAAVTRTPLDAPGTIGATPTPRPPDHLAPAGNAFSQDGFMRMLLGE